MDDPKKLENMLKNLANTIVFDSNTSQQSSIDELVIAAKKEPNNPKIISKLGRAYINNEDYKNAETNYKKLAEMFPDKKEMHVVYGINCVFSKNFKQSIVSLKKAIELDPNNIDSYIYLGKSLNKAQKYLETIKVLSIAKKKKPNDRDILFELGYAQVYSEKFEDSIPHLKKVLDMNEDDYEAITTLALSYLHLKKFNEIIPLYQKIIELNLPTINKEHIHGLLGLAYSNIGNKNMAIQEYESANSISPSLKSYSELGLLYYQTEQIDKAINSAQKALKFDPNSQTDHLVLGCCYVENDNFDDAKTEFKSALTPDSNCIVAVNAKKLLDGLVNSGL